MDKYELSAGTGRTKVSLLAYFLGKDLVVCLFNENAHVGAVAVAEYDPKEKRVSSSVITRLGHKDDVIAVEAARTLSKYTEKTVCVSAGIHVEKITPAEIKTIVKNAKSLVGQLCNNIKTDGSLEARE